jgi:hypothetical protein
MKFVKFELFTEVTIEDAVLWDVAPPYGSYKKQCFGRTYHLHDLGENHKRTRNKVRGTLL